MVDMEFHGIDEFMLKLKARYDRSERKQDWRALSGRDHVCSTYDTFILTDERVFQIKAIEVVPGKMAAVAQDVGSGSCDLAEMTRVGAPVPLSVVSRPKDACAVLMFGMQQYSSDLADMFKREYYSSKQDLLKNELDRQVKVLLERPEYRSAYRSLKEREEGYFA